MCKTNNFVSCENNNFKSLIDDLYRKASEQHTTYETVIFKSFCSSMDKNFNKDNVEAYDYARKEYGYLPSSEIEQIDIKNESNGVCSHGLDVWTCPAGCFEGD